MTHILRAGVVLYHGATEFPHCATVGGARFWVGVTTSEKMMPDTGNTFKYIKRADPPRQAP